MAFASAAAWACTAFASMEISPHEGQAGTTVRVVARNFTGGPVEVRWDSPSGPLLGTGTGPNFSISVTVPPSAAAGVYYVVAIQPNEGKASRAFEVTSSAVAGSTDPQRRAAPRDSSGDSSGVTSGATAGTTSEPNTTGSGPSSGSAGGAPAPRQSGGAAISAPADEGQGASHGGSASPAAYGGDERRAGNPTEQGSRTRATSSSSAGDVDGSRPPQRSGVPGALAGTDDAPSPAPATPTDVTTALSSRMAAGDLWGGFHSAPATSRGAGLDATTSGPPSPPTAPLVAGLALMGLAALALGFVLGPVTRRQLVPRAPR